LNYKTFLSENGEGQYHI